LDCLYTTDPVTQGNQMNGSPKPRWTLTLVSSLELQAFRRFLAFGTDCTQFDIWTGSVEHNRINHKIASASGLLCFLVGLLVWRPWRIPLHSESVLVINVTLEIALTLFFSNVFSIVFT
jgi:hypothetical protein